MKRNGFILTFVILFVLESTLIVPLFAKETKIGSRQLIIRDRKMLDANRIATWLINNATCGRHPETGSAGFYYPRESGKTAIYNSGLWFAGEVNGQLRTACSDYNVEYQPGIILPNGVPDDPNLEKYRIYKIKPGDSADPSDPNYNRDYAEWPVEDGAPVDENGRPLILGDQTLWCVMNDGNPDLHASCYSTPPFKLELRLLAWAFDDETTPLGKTVFLQYTLINTLNEPINDAYVGFYVDPDLGDAVDDGSACDTTLNLTYVYNRKNVDTMYGEAVPAVGVCLLQGPTIPASGETAFRFLQPPLQHAKNLSLTANAVYY